MGLGQAPKAPCMSQCLQAALRGARLSRRRGQAAEVGGDGILALARLARLARGTAAASPQRAAGGGGSRGSWHQAWLQAQGEEWLPGSGRRSVPAESRRGRRRGSARTEPPGCGSAAPLVLAFPATGDSSEGRRAGTDRPARGATRTCGTDGAGGGARPPPLGRGQPCAPRARRGGTGGAAASQPHLTLAAARAGGRRRGPSGSRAAHEVSPSRIGAAHLLLRIAQPRGTQRRCCGAELGEGTPTEIQRQVSPRMVRLSKLMGMTLASRVLCWS